MNSRPAPSGSEQTDSPSSPISTSSSPGPTEVTTAAATHGLTTAQIVGIVVAAIASLILIVGAIVLTSCCFRRRRLRSLETPNTTSSSDVSASNPWPFQKQIETAIPPPWELKDPRPGPGGVGISRRMQAAPEQAPPVPQVSRKETTEVAPELIGVAIGTTDDDENTPDSIQSTRTLSRLLPDPPSSIDQQYANQKRRTSIYSQGTVFEEDNPLANRKVGNPGAPVPLTPVYTRFPNQNPPVQIATEIGTSSERRPSLTLAIPPTAFKANTATIRPPRIVKMKQPSDSRAGQRETHYSQSQTRMNSLKQQHSQNEVKFLHPNYSAKPLAANSAGASRTRRPDIQKVGTRGSLYSVSSRRPRDSTCSETSFESGDDDPTPPEETAKKLSPVKESPISAIRYPKIPRSSNQMIPRRSPNSPRTDSENTGSPKQRSWRNDVSRLDDGTDSSSSISTLLAKRRGDAAAQDIERRLGLPPIYATASQDRLSNAQSPKTASSSNTLGSNVQSWQVVGGNRANFANALKHRAAGASGLREPTWIEDAAMSPTALRSPMWEPRLTPTRRGDDLMLSVT
ncbi:MAG: hypothetical protein M1820_006557 [Bogoriella megaspora]|nr:MAG: hypothetical protein M1820_006557 [Bogoriella megaspora]